MVATNTLATREESRKSPISPPTRVFDASQLEKLIQALERRGYAVIGPKVRDGAITYAPVHSLEDLPQGWCDEQSPGRYRLNRGENGAFFGYTIGPDTWKRYLHPPEVCLWSAKREDSSFRILNHEAQPAKPMAFLGVRACELAAIAAQDRVLLEGQFRDPVYAVRRESAVIIGVQCTQASEDCFCGSMASGPAISSADVILTELDGPGGHRFLASSATELGSELLDELQTTPASDSEIDEARDLVEAAARGQVRAIETSGLKDLLYQNFEHPRWEAVASRCLACANCTMVCPTCFCTTVEDASDITGQRAERWRRWDSCFTQSFSYIHGGSIRTSGKARYRQWLTHKLAAWIDQFGISGCVGCGRCITWCPAGIDMTEEVRALREGANYGNS